MFNLRFRLTKLTLDENGGRVLECTSDPDIDAPQGIMSYPEIDKFEFYVDPQVDIGILAPGDFVSMEIKRLDTPVKSKKRKRK